MMEDLTKNGDLSYTAQRAAGNGLKGAVYNARVYWIDLEWYAQAKKQGIVTGISVNGESWIIVDEEGLNILREWHKRRILHLREVKQ